MTYALSDIVESLKAARDRHGLTQRIFAERTGTTQARVSKIENGETDPRISTLIEFARALDLELMLVPRQHIPAVRAILTHQPKSASEKAGQTMLDRLRGLIIQLKEQFPQNEHLERLERTSRELANFRLSEERASAIARISEHLKIVQKTPALASTLDTHASALRQLRNEIAHAVPDEASEPRPAYRLDANDDE
ncbi:MAG TPA: helix-turn-helix transcriptional regulator [Hyphomonas sp.]|nr:hypothetical protein [Hyphomonas sp.]HRJ00898.1 helix-turn-helix transcriptional regulator [Hyphomonas sp.]